MKFTQNMYMKDLKEKERFEKKIVTKAKREGVPSEIYAFMI